MKKMITVSVGLMFLFLSQTASAVPLTWVDTYDPADVYIGKNGIVSFTHDITDNGFDPSQDLITSYILSISLYDDGDSAKEKAKIVLPDFCSSGFYNFSYESQTFGDSILGMLKLNENGQLSVKIRSKQGDFYFGSSTLTAYGDAPEAVLDSVVINCQVPESDVALLPVPEPSTMLLLGSGLLGLGLIRRKIFDK